MEKSIRLLRGIDGPLRLERIIEKGFFIDSSASLLLQLCDLLAYAARKREEAALGLPRKPFDEQSLAAVDRLVVRGNEALRDVLAWIAEQQKKERPGI